MTPTAPSQDRIDAVCDLLHERKRTAASLSPDEVVNLAADLRENGLDAVSRVAGIVETEADLHFAAGNATKGDLWHAIGNSVRGLWR